MKFLIFLTFVFLSISLQAKNEDEITTTKSSPSNCNHLFEFIHGDLFFIF